MWVCSVLSCAHCSFQFPVTLHRTIAPLAFACHTKLHECHSFRPSAPSTTALFAKLPRQYLSNVFNQISGTTKTTITASVFTVFDDASGALCMCVLDNSFVSIWPPHDRQKRASARNEQYCVEEACAKWANVEINALNWKSNNRCSAYLREQNISGCHSVFRLKPARVRSCRSFTNIICMFFLPIHLVFFYDLASFAYTLDKWKNDFACI